MSTRVHKLSRGYFYDNSISIAGIDFISNFITVENSALLFKVIAEQPEYNYVIVRGTNQMFSFHFSEVFSAGRYKVLRRKDNVNAALSQLAEKIPLGSNSTVLEYEASWLITFGLNSFAIDRLNYSIELGSTRIRPWQLLYTAHRSLGLTDKANECMKRCFALHGQQACRTPQPKVILHPEYNIDL